MKYSEWLKYLHRRFWNDVMDVMDKQVRKTRSPFFREQVEAELIEKLFSFILRG